MTPSTLFTELTLPNGAVLPNRLAKASMEENMADRQQLPDQALWTLYDGWAKGGAGLILTGNVMVDGRALTGPGGVVLENGQDLAPFKRWAQAGKSGGGQLWMQINHPGRQVFERMGQQAWAPSAVPLDLGSYSKLFAQPREMTAADIADVVRRFARTAQMAEQAGFNGVEIHAAHGYLLSQFLSPLSNRRTDQWGGSLENRARLLIDVVKAVRAVVSPGFGVGVKLNSADFQRGGFDVADARAVVEWLNDLSVDLVELSGGSYEAPAMQGQSRDGRTLAREAYFLDFARDIAQAARMPVMVTGGIRRQAVAEQVLNSGISVVGMATALALEPALPQHWRAGRQTVPEMPPITWKNKSAASMAQMAMVKHQLRRLSRAQASQPQVSPVLALVCDQLGTLRRTRQYRRWMAQRGTTNVLFSSTRTD
ncbi:MAG: NADH:flavin oxidoreductase/NADH oxidase family protein [Burkholderiales bacterium]|nr:NADH:flavin oxidoreductase/NADH oxidase family protein [Burkholderiales bacterium]